MKQWFLSIISERNGKGSAKRIAGVLALLLLFEITQVVIFATKELPNKELILKILEYTFIIVAVALVGISAPDIISYIRAKVPFLPNSATEVETLEETTTTTTTINQ